MKNEEQIKQALADLGGNTTTGEQCQGAPKIRRETKKRVLADVLELGKRKICVECLAVEEEEGEWVLPRLCPDCGDQTQTRLGEERISP